MKRRHFLQGLAVLPAVPAAFARQPSRPSPEAPQAQTTDELPKLEPSVADAAAEMMPRHPIARWGVPEDFGGIAVFLAGDASKWTTGATFVIDGGYTVAAKVAT